MQWALFDGLPLESVDRIIAAARRVRLPRGGILFREGEHAETVYLIESGKVAVRISTPEGALVTVAVLGAGSAVGELALVGDDEHRTATVQAVEPVVALTLRAATSPNSGGSIPRSPSSWSRAWRRRCGGSTLSWWRPSICPPRCGSDGAFTPSRRCTTQDRRS